MAPVNATTPTATTGNRCDVRWDSKPRFGIRIVTPTFLHSHHTDFSFYYEGAVRSRGEAVSHGQRLLEAWPLPSVRKWRRPSSLEFCLDLPRLARRQRYCDQGGTAKQLSTVVPLPRWAAGLLRRPMLRRKTWNNDHK